MIAAVCSAVGVAFALTGSQWGGVAASDGTVAMGQGITISLVSALPLLAAVGLTGTRTRRHALQTWAPLLLIALAFGAVAVAYLRAPAWEGMAPGLLSASALSGGAIAWWTIPRLRGPLGVRVTIGGLIGVAYAADRSRSPACPTIRGARFRP